VEGIQIGDVANFQ